MSRWCVGTFLAVLLLSLTATAKGDDEPTYQGRPLHEWVKLLKKGDGAARQRAALAIGEMGPKAKAAVPDLVDALKDKSGRVRRFAAKALGQIGPKAKAAVPSLTEALKDDEVGSMAGYALKKIDPEAARKAGVK